MLKSGFDAQPRLSNAQFTLTPLQENDRTALTDAAGDPAIWAGHPARDRHQPDRFAPYFDMLLASQATLTFTDTSNGQMIGCSRYYSAPDMPDTVSIGFTFLTRAYWGGSANFAIKRMMLDHAFASETAVWFHIDPTNIRSQKATLKLGATHEYDASLALVDTPFDWKCYRLSRENWAQTVSART